MPARGCVAYRTSGPGSYPLLAAERVRNHPEIPLPLADVYADYICDAVLAEEMGFVRSLVRRAPLPRVPVDGLADPRRAPRWQRKTTRLRVGTAVALLPFHDPIRVAEDVAICDILSGGRFDLGIGPGLAVRGVPIVRHRPEEMNGRTWESIDWILRRLPGEGRVQPQGPLLRHPGHDVHDQAGAEPDARSGRAAMGPKNQRRAAERGFNFIGPFNPGYDAQLAAAGRNPSRPPVASMQVICVADSAERAWEIAGPGLEYFVNFYETRQGPQGEPAAGARRDHAGDDPRRQRRVLERRRGHARRRDQGPGPVRGGALGRITELAVRVPPPGHAQRRDRTSRCGCSTSTCSPRCARWRRAKSSARRRSLAAGNRLREDLERLLIGAIGRRLLYAPPGTAKPWSAPGWISARPRPSGMSLTASMYGLFASGDCILSSEPKRCTAARRRSRQRGEESRRPRSCRTRDAARHRP